MRRLSEHQTKDLQAQIAGWLKDGVVEPAESPWGSPLVPVAKKDGATRWAVDYRALNAVTVADSYPCP